MTTKLRVGMTVFLLLLLAMAAVMFNGMVGQWVLWLLVLPVWLLTLAAVWLVGSFGEG